ncbi:MAG: CBS domain-containing protein [Chitinispirillaceae bacterium]|nr:CBS domain-containing protein [Chitinispirillaceae bacterium]
MKAKELIGVENSVMHTIDRDTTIHAAITKLTDFKIGALLVAEGETVFGIISERDILTVCSHCKNDYICSMKVSEVMTTNIVYADMEDDLVEVMKTFRKNHIRHIPLKSDGKVKAMISMRDINRTLIDAISTENERLVEYITGKYMA